MSTGKALVLGDDTRSFLATVRSLGRRGITVHAAPANLRSPALRSRYIAAIHDIPPWMGAGEAWLGAMEALLRAERFDLVMPCNETAMLPLQRHRAQLEPLARLAVPDDAAIEQLFDKHATRELARRCGIPVAPGRLLRPDDTADILLAEFGPLVVLKPRRSYTLETIGSRAKVTIAHDVETARHALQGIDPEQTLVEQCFPGQGLGVSLLASKGRVLQTFEHHRVHELAGASYYRISAPVSPELAQACSAMVSAVGYTGLAMFEFKRNDRGHWILLEVNARPWGSMPLPVALGVDFPYRWYRLLTAGEETSAVAYRNGVYGRNLVPDLRTSVSEAAAAGRGGAASARLMLVRGLELFRWPFGKEVHDVLVRDDLRPGLAELAGLGASTCRRLTRELPGRIARQRRSWMQQVRRLAANRGDRYVLFVCQGNICRSPFAAALLRARLGQDSAIPVASAGMIPRPGRTTPPVGIQAAKSFGVDLAGHRSAWLTRQLADEASMLVVFDTRNREAILDRYPDLTAKIVQLLPDAEIADPIDGGAAEFQFCYRTIVEGTENLARILRSN